MDFVELVYLLDVGEMFAVWNRGRFMYIMEFTVWEKKLMQNTHTHKMCEREWR